MRKEYSLHAQFIGIHPLVTGWVLPAAYASASCSAAPVIMADGELQVQGKLEHEAVANGETVNNVIEETNPAEETAKKKKKKKKKKSAASGWN